MIAIKISQTIRCVWPTSVNGKTNSPSTKKMNTMSQDKRKRSSAMKMLTVWIRASQTRKDCASFRNDSFKTINMVLIIMSVRREDRTTTVKMKTTFSPPIINCQITSKTTTITNSGTIWLSPHRSQETLVTKLATVTYQKYSQTR